MIFNVQVNSADKIKTKKYHTVGTDPKSNSKIVETELKSDTLLKFGNLKTMLEKYIIRSIVY